MLFLFLKNNPQNFQHNIQLNILERIWKRSPVAIEDIPTCEEKVVYKLQYIFFLFVFSANFPETKSQDHFGIIYVIFQRFI